MGDNWGFYAGDAAGRLAGCHIAWGGSVYFDTTSGWERINKAAVEDEYKGQWRHWTFAKNADTGEKKIYLDGVLWHSGTDFALPIEGVDRFFIGAGDNGASPYTGLIDDFRHRRRLVRPWQSRYAYRRPPVGSRL
ncbi:MAG: hypothetical protein ISS70_17060 [Phycisphaerae bacterium]|nr:hypothetical protein [Phycisphaerae bacterium]